MKTVIVYLVLALCAATAEARVPPGPEYEVKGAMRMWGGGFRITQKVDGGYVVVNTDFGGPPEYGVYVSDREFTMGYLDACGVRMGVSEITMENGFQQKAWVFMDCVKVMKEQQKKNRKKAK